MTVTALFSVATPALNLHLLTAPPAAEAQEAGTVRIEWILSPRGWSRTSRAREEA